jgi:hypothetical protein
MLLTAAIDSHRARKPPFFANGTGSSGATISIDKGRASRIGVPQGRGNPSPCSRLALMPSDQLSKKKFRNAKRPGRGKLSAGGFARQP